MEWLSALLVWLSVDPVVTDASAARAAAAVDCAYASMPRVVAEEKKVSGGKPLSECPTGQCPTPRR